MEEVCDAIKQRGRRRREPRLADLRLAVWVSRVDAARLRPDGRPATPVDRMTVRSRWARSGEGAVALKAKAMVQVNRVRRGDTRSFWRTSATIASVSCGAVVLDGFDRQVVTTMGELKPAGANRWILAWEIRTRP